jgi:hypothetical protein
MPTPPATVKAPVPVFVELTELEIVTFVELSTNCSPATIIPSFILNVIFSSQLIRADDY